MFFTEKHIGVCQKEADQNHATLPLNLFSNWKQIKKEREERKSSHIKEGSLDLTKIRKNLASRKFKKHR
jgi:hypothetical protein